MEEWHTVLWHGASVSYGTFACPSRSSKQQTNINSPKCSTGEARSASWKVGVGVERKIWNIISHPCCIILRFPLHSSSTWRPGSRQFKVWSRNCLPCQHDHKFNVDPFFLANPVGSLVLCVCLNSIIVHLDRVYRVKIFQCVSCFEGKQKRIRNQGVFHGFLWLTIHSGPRQTKGSKQRSDPAIALLFPKCVLWLDLTALRLEAGSWNLAAAPIMFFWSSAQGAALFSKWFSWMFLVVNMRGMNAQGKCNM